jgi:hypothetical protein
LVLAFAAGALALASRDTAPPDEEDEERELPEPVALRLLGPRDGKNSIGLPVTVAPAVGLTDGATVTLTGHGFQPGEAVVVVQCAIEAGRPAKGGEAAGVDGCDTSQVQSTSATSDGLATATFTVRQSITTPVTGLIDCGSESGRCIVAMAASSDYDRSGAGGITFGPGPEPGSAPAGPTLIVDPAFDLADAQVVHVTATGLPPSTEVELSVCSVDPGACWSTGRSDDPTTALVADATGALGVDVPAWRFLPGPEPDTYVDCALSACNLMLSTGTADADPVPARLLFTPGGEGPVRPAFSLDPSEDVAPGSTVVVLGAGFDPATTVSLALCVTADTGDDPDGLCIDLDASVSLADDGTFEASVVVPSVDSLGALRPAGAADEPGASAFPCDGESTRCVVRATVAYGDDVGGSLRARFGPDPVAITFARPAETSTTSTSETTTSTAP